jgi:putative transposase
LSESDNPTNTTTGISPEANILHYRRARISGGTYFFTVVTHLRRRIFNSERNIAVLRNAVREELALRPFQTDAFVLLPDHLHCLWTLPQGDHDFSTRWKRIKTRVTKTLGQELEGRIWQNRFWEHLVRDETDFARHLEYIHYNPVKHGFCASAWEWPHSSFRRYVARGVYAPDWGGGLELPGGMERVAGE